MMKPCNRYVTTLLCVLVAVSSVMSCSPAPTPTAVPPVPTPTVEPPPPPQVPALTPEPGTVDPSALLPYIPDSAHVLRAIRAELDGDEPPEIAVLLGFGSVPERLGYDRVEWLVLEPDRGPEQAIAWHHPALAGDRVESLEARDINGDGRLELLSVQSMGAAGQTLYVLAWRDGAYGLLTPHGGQFDGQDRFGEVGVRLEDLDSDGLPEILANYGPAATSTDVYRWDGEKYVFGMTLGDK